MSSQTPNINLTLPTGAEKVSRQIINDNNTKIDTAIGTLNGKITVEQGACTRVKNDLTFGSINLVYRFGRIVICSVVFATTVNASQDDVLFTVPYAIRFPVLAQIRKDLGGTYLIGTTNESTNNVSSLYGEGLPAGTYRGTFVYMATNI